MLRSPSLATERTPPPSKQAHVGSSPTHSGARATPGASSAATPQTLSGLQTELLAARQRAEMAELQSKFFQVQPRPPPCSFVMGYRCLAPDPHDRHRIYTVAEPLASPRAIACFRPAATRMQDQLHASHARAEGLSRDLEAAKRHAASSPAREAARCDPVPRPCGLALMHSASRMPRARCAAAPAPRRTPSSATARRRSRCATASCPPICAHPPTLSPG
jgi:hypothetical protein